MFENQKEYDEWAKRNSSKKFAKSDNTTPFDMSNSHIKSWGDLKSWADTTEQQSILTVTPPPKSIINKNSPDIPI